MKIMLIDEENNFSIAFVVFRTNLALVSFANEAQYRWRLLEWVWYISGEFREISIEYQQAWFINKFPSCIGGFVCLVCKIFTSNVAAEVTPRPRNSFNHILSSSWTASHWDRRGHPGRCWQELRSLTVKSHCFLRFVFRPSPIHCKPSVLTCGYFLPLAGHRDLVDLVSLLRYFVDISRWNRNNFPHHLHTV